MTINITTQKVSEKNPLLEILNLISRYTRNGDHLPGADKTNTKALDILSTID